MWWQDLLWGFWNGLTAWIVLIAHVFGAWSEFPFYNSARAGNWYDFGFLLGMGSPVLGGGLGARSRRRLGQPPSWWQRVTGAITIESRGIDLRGLRRIKIRSWGQCISGASLSARARSLWVRPGFRAVDYSSPPREHVMRKDLVIVGRSRHRRGLPLRRALGGRSRERAAAGNPCQWVGWPSSI